MDRRLKPIVKLSRILLLSVWAAVILITVVSFIAFPERFTATNIAGFIRSFGAEIWIVYLGMSAIRGFTLLPSTPLVLAGTILHACRRRTLHDRRADGR